MDHDRDHGRAALQLCGDQCARAERSLIGDHAAEGERGTAYGLYHLMAGLLVLPGAVLFGLLWQAFGSPAAFAAASGVTAGAAAWMVVIGRAGSTPARD